MKRVTIKDVALKACVSTSTVSHVINNSRFVDPHTKARVVAAMEELNYYPDFFARGMRSGVSKTIGLIVPDTANPFYAELSHRMEEHGYHAGYNVIFCNSGMDPEKEAYYVKTLVAKRVDGIILIGSDGTNSQAGALKENQVPTVICGQDSPLEFADVVTLDYGVGMSSAIMHLAGLGHKRIACISSHYPKVALDDYKESFFHALQANGLEAPAENFVTGEPDVNGGEACMNILLHLIDPPTAVVCFNDLMAIGAMVCCFKNGLRVPRDVSIIGFDNIAFAAFVEPGLTTVAQPMDELARVTMKLIIDRLKGDRKTEKRRIILEPALVVRASTSRRE